MNILWLRIRAPFAAFRCMQAGAYRATTPVMPPSAARGLILNLARAERGHIAGEEGAGAPPLRLAIGRVKESGVATLYQHVYSDPVSSSGMEPAHHARITYWSTLVRREVLIDLDCVLGVCSRDAALLDRVIRGLAGALGVCRHNLPFAGDNSFLIDRVDVLEHPCEACWYVRADSDAALPRGACRLTVTIDRGDSSKTQAAWFAPTEPMLAPPEHAWIRVPGQSAARR